MKSRASRHVKFGVFFACVWLTSAAALWPYSPAALRWVIGDSSVERAADRVSSNGRWLVTSVCYPGMTAADPAPGEIWDLESGTVAATYSELSGFVREISPDGTLLITEKVGGCDVLLVNGGHSILTIEDPKPFRRIEFCFSPDGQTLAYATEFGGQSLTHLWDCRTHQSLATLEDAGLPMCFSHDGTRFYCSDGSNRTSNKCEGIRIWDTAANRSFGQVETSGIVRSIELSNDGRFLAAGVVEPAEKVDSSEKAWWVVVVDTHTLELQSTIDSVWPFGFWSDEDAQRLLVMRESPAGEDALHVADPFTGTVAAKPIVAGFGRYYDIDPDGRFVAGRRSRSVDSPGNPFLDRLSDVATWVGVPAFSYGRSIIDTIEFIDLKTGEKIFGCSGTRGFFPVHIMGTPNDRSIVVNTWEPGNPIVFDVPPKRSVVWTAAWAITISVPLAALIHGAAGVLGWAMGRKPKAEARMPIH